MTSDGLATVAAVASLDSCPSCGSQYLQPMRCDARSEEEVVVDLRCSDCMTWLQVPFGREDMAELDRCQSEWRAEIVAAYERSVSESMEALAAILGPALALDLVGADDFAPPSRVRPRRAA
jgi:hypothetical protein